MFRCSWLFRWYNKNLVKCEKFLASLTLCDFGQGVNFKLFINSNVIVSVSFPCCDKIPHRSAWSREGSFCLMASESSVQGHLFLLLLGTVVGCTTWQQRKAEGSRPTHGGQQEGETGRGRAGAGGHSFPAHLPWHSPSDLAEWRETVMEPECRCKQASLWTKSHRMES